MNKDITLLVLAAGMGSRFGGLKQMEPIGENGEFIIDYSVNDAIESGFTKVVFVIKEENYELFKSTIGKRMENRIKVEYAFQKLDKVPEGIYREKPWGTGYAVLCAKDVINEPFAEITADDFYGLDAFMKLAEFLKTRLSPTNYVTIGYEVENTISNYGNVKRGIIATSGNYVKKIIESVIEREDDKLRAYPLDGSKSFLITPEYLSSMLMFGMNPNIFPILEENFNKFLNASDNLETEEFLFTMVLEECIREGILNIEVERTNAKWFGVTYKEDLEEVKEGIRKVYERK